MKAMMMKLIMKKLQILRNCIKKFNLQKNEINYLLRMQEKVMNLKDIKMKMKIIDSIKNFFFIIINIY